MFLSTIPLFDKKMAVKAYFFSAQKSTDLMTVTQNTSQLDGVTYSLALHVIHNLGIEALTGGQPFFVPINYIALLVDINNQCSAPPDKIIFVLDNTIDSSEMYISRIKTLKTLGYRFAIQNVKDFDNYSTILKLIDYVYLDQKNTDVKRSQVYLNANYPNLNLIVSNIADGQSFNEVRFGKYEMFEGPFYRLPLTYGNNVVSPLKVNYIQLLNIANDENFDINDVADIVQQDVALAISLLKLVNNLGMVSEIKTIKHATAMLGQSELRKWITTVVINQLCADKPDEITRLSLIRAKFAENLAPAFEMAILSKELFLMGLFSILDIIFDMPIAEAVKIIKISDKIKRALVDGKDTFAPVLMFIKSYEAADWQEVSRQLIIHNIHVSSIYNAYIDALQWYSNLISLT